MIYLIIFLVLYAAFATWRWWRRCRKAHWAKLTADYALRQERFWRKRAEWGNEIWARKYQGVLNQVRNWKARCDDLKAENAKLKTVLGFTATHADCLARMQLEGRE